MPTVSIVQRIVPHYRVAMLRTMRQVLESHGVGLEVIYGQEAAGTVPRSVDLEEPWAHRITNRYVRIGGTELVWQPCLRQAMRSDLVVVEQASRLLVNYALLAARTGDRRIAFWGHGENRQADDSRSVSERIKRRLSITVDWWFAYTESAARVVSHLGFPPDRITVVNNSIDTRGISTAVAAVSNQQQRETRAALGLPDAGVAIYCGRMVPEKRLDLLWPTLLETRRLHPGFHMLLVGDGPLEQEARSMADAHDWVHYVGAKSGAELARYYAVSDFMLLPGAVGLAILDAFAAGLPLVTSAVGTHGPEIDYLQPHVNGLITEPRAPEIAAACAQLLKSPQLLAQLRAGCQAAARAYTVEDMAARFSRGVLAALSDRNAVPVLQRPRA